MLEKDREIERERERERRERKKENEREWVREREREKKEENVFTLFDKTASCTFHSSFFASHSWIVFAVKTVLELSLILKHCSYKKWL